MIVVSSHTGDGHLPYHTTSVGTLNPLVNALTYVKNVPQECELAQKWCKCDRPLLNHLDK